MLVGCGLVTAANDFNIGICCDPHSYLVNLTCVESKTKTRRVSEQVDRLNG